MLYVGLDVHSKQITVCVLNSNGQVYQRCQVRQVDQLLAMLGGLSEPFQVCFEASTGYGRLFEELAKISARVVVAHPGALRLIFRSKKKSDRRDAEKLAKLLYLDAVPSVHVPTPDVRAWRELITFRRRLVEKRTRAKNGLRTLLRGQGITPPRRPGLWTLGGMAWLKQLEFAQSTHTLQRNLLIDEIESLTRQLALVEQELEARSRNDPRIWQLQSIPGVGLRTAEAFVAFLDDPHRFANSKRVGSYFGLVPSQDQSGNVNRLGRITRDGSATVRQLLAEAAWQAIRRSPTVKAFHARVKRDDPERNKTALVATAHYLARVMWAMLRDGSLWNESVEAEPAQAA
jgi:transposase